MIFLRLCPRLPHDIVCSTLPNSRHCEAIPFLRMGLRGLRCYGIHTTGTSAAPNYLSEGRACTHLAATESLQSQDARGLTSGERRAGTIKAFKSRGEKEEWVGVGLRARGLH